MKKILLSAILCSTLFASNSIAQLPDGSSAPDFTSTDQWGNSHTLSDYLAQGKTVIIDVSATWCGPCWGMHQAHTLRNLYNAYGPNGSDEIMIFFVEGDGQTTTADLEGTGGNTQGDWMTGTPYPVLDDASIASAYQISAYPTLFRVCPDGTTYASTGGASASDLLSDVQGTCGQGVTGVENHLGMKDGNGVLCSVSGDVAISFTNYGTNTVTSANVILTDGSGNQVGSQSFSGNVAQFAEGTVTFTGVGVGSYTAEVQTVNGGTAFSSASPSPEYAPSTTSTAELSLAPEAGLNITVNVFTDLYAVETSWALKNSAGSTVASGGPYTEGTDDQWGGGGPDANTTMVHEVTLPAGEDCYSFELYDSFGDGQQYGTSENPNGGFGFAILSNGVSITNVSAGGFGAELISDGVARTTASSGIAEAELDNVQVYPNPATDVVNISFENTNDTYVSIMDLQGRVLGTQVASGANGTQVISFSTEGFAKGTYVISVDTNGLTTNSNVVIK